jgi:uncharacterized Zn finger protein (UPF0148 family)
MARFRCRACRAEGTFEYTGGHACPICGFRDVQLAIATEELSDDHPLIVALTKMADDSTDFPDRVMSIAKEDIKPGWYWVLSRKDGELSIVCVETFDIEIDGPETVVMHHGWEFSEKVDTALEKLDFIARIEPPDRLNYVSYKATERRRESMFVLGCAGAIMVAVLFGATAAGLFIAGFRWGLYLLAGIPLAVAVGVGLMVPAISQDGAAHWLPRPLRDFTLAILNHVRGR